MSWFEEQILLRQKMDENNLSDAYLQIASAITGKNYYDAFNNLSNINKNEINEILKYFRYKAVDVPSEITSVSEQLDYICRPYGIMRKPVKLTKGWYKDAFGPFIAIRKNEDENSRELVALIPSKSGGYSYYDKESNKRVKVTSHNEGLFHEDAITFFKPFPSKELNLWEIFKYILSTLTAMDVVKICLATFGATILGLVIPKATLYLLEVVSKSGDINVLLGTGIFLISVIVSIGIINGIRELLLAGLSCKVDVGLSAATMMRVLSLPADFFKKYSAGTLAGRIEYVNSLGEMIVSSVLSGLITSVFSLLYIFQIKDFSVELSKPAIIILVIQTIVSIILGLLQMNIIQKIYETSTKESGMCFAVLNGIQKIKITGSENRMFARWAGIYSKKAALEYNPPWYIKCSSAITNSIALLGTLWIYIIAISCKVLPENYYAFNAAYGCVEAAFLELTAIALIAANFRPVLKMVKPIFETLPEVTEEKKIITKMNGAVELNNVSFSYNEDSPLILDGINLKIKNGQYVAIVGKTGCGKSTLIRLLLGFEKANSGTIYYGNKGLDINEIDKRSLRKNIGVVTQDGSLFAGDIYSNIVISSPMLTLDDAWEAAKIAGIDEDIRNMPMGMNTFISEGNGGLSGGQKQRLMIARAVAPKPKILILDEATSALDNITQKHVSDALEQQKITRIVVAHRLSTIKNCDRIVVLDGGKIAEDGTYEELIAKNGLFKELVNRQRVEV